MDSMDQNMVPQPSKYLEPAVKRRRLNPDTLQHLEPTSEKSQPGPVPLSHRVYEKISADGHSRNVYGDIYNTYHVHPQDNASMPAGPFVDSGKATDDATKALMKALAFDQMDTRLATITNAHAQTCEWLFAREEYVSWRDSEALRKHRGFFWVKGKPGAGKSTLMKCAQQYGRDTHQDLAISFFFNARGGDLEKSAEGMYRSLLYQLLEAMPQLGPAMGNHSKRSTKQSWPLAELGIMLEKAVQSLGSIAVACYIDALDECKDDEARKMVEHFEALGQCAVKADTEFRVLLSSRHYPHIVLDDCLELKLENQKGHESDIAEYIRRKLKIGKGRLALEIHNEIQRRACGVFLWVVLVIRILNECDARGRTHLLKKRLATIPDGLSELFEEVLKRGTNDPDDTLLTFQWILFAQRPLRREELYFAVITGSSDDAIEEWDDREITLDVMERFLLDSSKGLAEMTKGIHPRVQFIHESVRDYLLDKGFAVMKPTLSEDILSISHERLRDCCFWYLMNSQAVLLPTPQVGIKVQMPDITGERQDQVAATHPFLGYAVDGILHHANLAHSLSLPQDSFVDKFPHRLWRRCYNLCCRIQRQWLRVDTQPLYTFVLWGELHLADIELRKMSCKVENRIEGEYHRTLLGATVDQRDHAMMNLLLSHGVDPNDSSEPRASCCLPLAIQTRDTTMVRTLIEHGAGPICIAPGDSTFVESLQYSLKKSHRDQDVIECILTGTPYSLTPRWNQTFTRSLLLSRRLGYHSIERLLSRRLETFVNGVKESKKSATAECLGYAFVAACGFGDVALVKILIEHGVLQASDKVRPAFKAVACNGHDEVARTLLDNGVAVNLMLDELGSTALTHASANGHASLVRLLLHREAEVARESTALHSAAVAGHAAIVQMLLDAGADPNTYADFRNALAESWRGTALHMAVRSGSAETVRMLLDHPGIDANVLDADGDHAIVTASRCGYIDCMQLLLEREIPLEHLNAAAAMAWDGDSVEIMDMLLAKGATPPEDYERSSDSSSSPSQQYLVLLVHQDIHAFISVALWF